MHAARVLENKKQKVKCNGKGCITNLRADNLKYGYCDRCWSKKFAS